MDSFNINVEKRTLVGKNGLKKLKRKGRIPAVLYNFGNSIPVSLEEEEIRTILNKHGNDVFFNLKFDGVNMSTRIKEIQKNPLNQEIQHIDLMPVDKGSNLLH